MKKFILIFITIFLHFEMEDEIDEPDYNFDSLLITLPELVQRNN